MPVAFVRRRCSDRRAATLALNHNGQRYTPMAQSRAAKGPSRPVLDILGTIRAEGVRQQILRLGLEVQKVRLTLAALGQFDLSNRYTLSSTLGTPWRSPSNAMPGPRRHDARGARGAGGATHFLITRFF